MHLLNISTRIQLLSSYLQTTPLALRDLCVKIIRTAQDENKGSLYRSISNCRNIFAPVRSDGSPSAGEAAALKDVRDVNLIFDASLIQARAIGIACGETHRLDAPIGLFLQAVEADIEVVKACLPPDEQSLVEYVEQFCLPKAAFLPPAAILPNHQLQVDLSVEQPYFSLFRRTALSSDDVEIVEEKLVFSDPKNWKLTYHDHMGNTFSGVAFLSKEKIVAVCFSQDTSLEVMGVCSIILFRNQISRDEYLIYLTRSSVSDGRTNSYKCIGLARELDFEVYGNMGPTDIRQIRYFYSTLNTNESEKSYEVSLDDARKSLDRGIMMTKVFKEDPEKYRNIDSLDKMVSRLEEHSGN